MDRKLTYKRWYVPYVDSVKCLSYKGWILRIVGLGVTASHQNFVGIEEVKAVEFPAPSMHWFEVLWVLWTPEWFLRYNNLRNWICELVTTQEQSWSASQCRSPRIPAARSPGRLNFVRWCLIFVGPQYGTCFMSLLWHLEFWRGCYILGTLCISELSTGKFVCVSCPAHLSLCRR
jgi:hypothetical protein